MPQLSSEFIKKIAHSLEEEETDVYTLSLYSMNGDDLKYFNEPDRERIKRIFTILLDDTKHHSELLKLIVELGSNSGKKIL